MGKCRPLSDPEIELMKIHTPDVRDKAILIMLERTGYRSNEVASLKTEDVFEFSSNTLKPRIQVKREHMKKKQGRRSIPHTAQNGYGDRQDRWRVTPEPCRSVTPVGAEATTPAVEASQRGPHERRDAC